MLSAVMNGPGPSTSRTRRPRAERSTSRATTPISSGGTDPRLLRISAWSASPGGSVAASRPAMVATIAETAARSIRSTPGSPWMPRPSSASSSPMRASSGRPGMAQEVSATPSERMSRAAARAAAATSASGAPCSARWPAILWTKSVPATPRGCGMSGSATSSATITVSTFSPSARARSAARPKFSRSPV